MIVYGKKCLCFGGYLASYYTVTVEPKIRSTEIMLQQFFVLVNLFHVTGLSYILPANTRKVLLF